MLHRTLANRRPLRHAQTLIDLLRKCEREIGAKAGTDKMDFKILTGSIGAREATVQANHTVESIAQRERFFESIGKIDADRQWSKDLEPMSCPAPRSGIFIVSSDDRSPFADRPKGP